ncbi:MAG: PDZ domain-containing protein [Clostridia bacterium]
MFPFGKVVVTVLMLIPQVLLHPAFWMVVLLVAMQYARMARVEQRVFGQAIESPASLVLTSLLLGAAAGFVASLIFVFVGVTVTGAGVAFLLPVALVLMLIDPRFLCFSYAGGLLALSNLVLGVPKVGIPEIMILVAVLHLMESLLIWTTGAQGALPLYMKTRDGGVVGGFLLQKFWPIPLVGMMLLTPRLSEIESLARGLISMPDWWPLIKPDIAVPEGRELLFAMFALPAALGYGDFAVARTPRERSSRTARSLMAFSVVLLAMALGASVWPWMRWLAALFSPLGHEMVIAAGRRTETRSKAAYVPDPRGLKVLDVVPRSPAARVGLRSGDILIAVNGQPVRSAADLLNAMSGSPPWFYIEAERDADAAHETHGGGSGDRAPVRFTKSISGDVDRLGIIPVPGPGDEAHVSVPAAGVDGPIARWFRRK